MPHDALARGVMQSASDGIMVFASVRDGAGAIRDFRWLELNEAAERIVGRERAQLIGRCLLEEMPGNRDDRLFDRYVDVVESGRPYRTELSYRHDGVDAVLRLAAARVDDGFTVTFRDVTRERRRESEQAQRALRDELTGLANRTLLQDRLERIVSSAALRDVAIAVFVIDLDRFAAVNQTLGFAVGDQVLVDLSRQLQRSLKPGDTLARTGGDEFTLVCHDLSDEMDIAQRGQLVADACRTTARSDGTSIDVTASIGVALAVGAETNIDLVRDAHAAMHRAKAGGRDRLEFADASLRAGLEERAAIVQGLRSATEQGEIEVHYQPLFSPTRDLVGAEALVRWRRHGVLVGPHVFLPAAEEHGMMKMLGEHVLRSAVCQVARWDRERGHGSVPVIAVNLAADQIDHSLPDLVDDALTTAGLTADRLCLEVTESSLIADQETARSALDSVAARGVSVALDDFGTGYSPLTYLRHLPVDVVKIDRSFVARIDEDPADAAVVEAVVGLAHRLSKRVVAEGVETMAQLDLVTQFDIDAVQGYLLGRPVPASEFAELLARPSTIGAAS